MPDSWRRGLTPSPTALFLDYALLLEVLGGHVFGVFLVEVDLCVQFAHLLHVEAGGDLVEDALYLWVLLEHVATDDRCRVVERPDALLVLHYHELRGGQLAVGGEADAHVAVAVLQTGVAEAELVDDLDLLEVERRVVLLYVG